MLLQHSRGAFPLDVEDAGRWQDGCALGHIHKAAFHVKRWVLALTSPVRPIQGLPSLQITGVNLQKVFSGKDSPFSCVSQPWKCKLFVAA